MENQLPLPLAQNEAPKHIDFPLNQPIQHSRPVYLRGWRWRRYELPNRFLPTLRTDINGNDLPRAA